MMYLFTYCDNNGKHESMNTISAKDERINDLKAMILDELLLNADIETPFHILKRDRHETNDEYFTLINK